MKAWEREYNWIQKAIPPKNMDSKEEDWMKYLEAGLASDKKLYKDWISFVPGSQSPSHIVIAAIQSMHNMGYDVSEAEQWMEAGLKAAEKKDGAELQRITAKIYSLLNCAPKIEDAPYWQYKQYRSWEEIAKAVEFPQAITVDVTKPEFYEKIRNGWTSQIIGGALGTQLEGYTAENIKAAFGEIRGYIRPPETYNDDITYELAFLEAFVEKGYEVSSEDIAYQWLALIPDGYSAEEMAIRNLRRGIMPPQSGTTNNYYTDWIGVQMRTPIHGMVAPGNPKLAAELAVRDGVISHSNSGILGGIFNAVLVSMAFVEHDIKTLLKKSISCIPKDSEYFSVLEYAWNACQNYNTWEEAWRLCAEKYKEYNWVHSYPNAAAEIIALWYGEGDFDETAYIIAMEGLDVDCTAAPVLNALAIIIGIEKIDEKWINPLGAEVFTFMRKLNHFTLEELFQKTVTAVRNAEVSSS